MAKRDSIRFFRSFLKNPTTVGAIAPSSRILANAMIKGIELSPGDSIVEFGPGTGALTSAIHEQLRNPQAYIGIEREEKFVEHLRRRFADFHFYHGSAQDAPSILAEHNITQVKAVISGLPFTLLPKTVQDDIFLALKQILAPGACFRTFQYAHALMLPPAIRFRREMDAIFGRHKRQALIVRNLPPAYVLAWECNTTSATTQNRKERSDRVESHRVSS